MAAEASIAVFIKRKSKPAWPGLQSSRSSLISAILPRRPAITRLNKIARFILKRNRSRQPRRRENVAKTPAPPKHHRHHAKRLGPGIAAGKKMRQAALLSAIANGA